MFHCPVGVWVIEQRAIILSATVRSPTVWLLTVDCIVYSDIVNTFKSSYLHSILPIAIIETPECQHCIVWQWAAFWVRGKGKLPTIKQRKFDLNLSSK